MTSYRLSGDSIPLNREPMFVIQLHSHFFKVIGIQASGTRYLGQFMSLYLHASFRQPSPRFSQQKSQDKLYAFYTKDHKEYRFHVGQLEPFFKFLAFRGMDASYYRVEQIDIPKSLPLKAQVKEHWALRDEQPEAVDFVLRDMPDDLHSRLVTLAPGCGKTLLSLWAACQRKQRVAIVILSGYLEKWVGDIQNVTTASVKDIMVVQGGSSLRGLIHLAKNDQYQSDFVLISTQTWVDYLKSYGEDPTYCVEVQYGCAPEELYGLLGIGTVLIDEIHQHLHAVYRTFCFMNVDRAIGLSGTFLSNDSFVEKIQHLMFPKEIRFANAKPKKYVHAYGISYSVLAATRPVIKTTEPRSTTYSQTVFEKSILKIPRITRAYLDIITECVRHGFMDQFQPGMKCIIFARTIKMCTVIVEHLKTVYPDLDIRRYTQIDPYENVIDPDIRVTTQQSGGTAVDIPGLVTNITTDNMRSHQSNLQCLGRLREPKVGIARYFSVYSEGIPKHVEYHQERQQLFRDRVVTFKEFRTNLAL